MRRRVRAILLLTTSLALLALAPGALASTLTVDGSGNLVYTAAAGKVTAIELDQQSSPLTTVVVHEVQSGGTMALGGEDLGAFADTDNITASGNCTNDADSDSTPDTDANGDPIFTCTGVTGSAHADTLDGADAVDASGVLSDVGGAGLATIPLIANLGDANDAAIGGGSGDVIHGNAGNDGIGGDQGSSTGGDDQLFGDDGADTVVGGPGNDTIDGGNGNDSIFGDCNGSCSTGTPGNDTLTGGAGDDGVRGEQGNDSVDGGAGDDLAAGGPGTDTVTGGDGDDNANGGPGNDNVGGGAGDDAVNGDCGGYRNCGNGSDGNDVVHGDAGNDSFTADGGADVISGGTGFDEVSYADETCDTNGCHASAPSVTPDDIANDGQAGEGDNVASDVEDAALFDPCNPSGCNSAAADDHPGNGTLSGSAGPNDLQGGSGADTITGGDGNDFLFGNGGNDTINANDGFADRVSCGAGVDVANVDQFDQVADDCETVNVTNLASSAIEDRQPTVAFTTPAADGAKMSTSGPNQIAATASDDRGIVQVVFLAGKRVLCADTTAPYTCAYNPNDSDVGRRTLEAVAVDTSQQTATALREVAVGRFTPRSVTARTTPKRDAHSPFHFRTSGKVLLPAGVTATQGCTGKVVVTFKAGRKTVSTRHATLSKSCSYRSSVTFRILGRLHPRQLRVFVSFRGNAVMGIGHHRAYSVRVK